jgi:tetratricopeptide (TPR) repeat protein
MMKRFLAAPFFVASIVVTQTVGAQTNTLTGASKWADSASREIEAASDAGDIGRLKAAGTLLDRALVAFPNDALLLHYKGYELHREASLQEGLNHRDEIGPLLDEAQSVLERSLEIKPLPETQALLSSILGRQIAIHPWKAMVLGPQSGSAMTNAIALGPNNPRVWLLRGMGAMFTPKQFGGGLANSETYLKKAEQLFADDHPVAPAPAWGRAELYAWLGQVYEKENRKPDAILAYNKALEINPDMRWVKYVLLPSAQSR